MRAVDQPLERVTVDLSVETDLGGAMAEPPAGRVDGIGGVVQADALRLEIGDDPADFQRRHPHRHEVTSRCKFGHDGCQQRR